MSKNRRILNKIQGMSKDNTAKLEKQKKYYDVAERYLDRQEEEKEKDEVTKTHDRYRRNQQRRAYTVDLDVQKPKKIQQKPGTYFYGPLRKLAADFGDILEMTRYMTVGQLVKYQERDGLLYNIKTGKVAYNPETKEVFE